MGLLIQEWFLGIECSLTAIFSGRDCASREAFFFVSSLLRGTLDFILPFHEVKLPSLINISRHMSIWIPNRWPRHLRYMLWWILRWLSPHTLIPSSIIPRKLRLEVDKVLIGKPIILIFIHISKHPYKIILRKPQWQLINNKTEIWKCHTPGLSDIKLPENFLSLCKLLIKLQLKVLQQVFQLVASYQWINQSLTFVHEVLDAWRRLIEPNGVVLMLENFSAFSNSLLT